MKVRHIVFGTAAAAATLIASAPGASAGSPKLDSFPIVCDNGSTYTAWGNGNGEWTPAHDLNGTATFVPAGFGDFTGTAYDPEGNVVDSFVLPATMKKGQHDYDTRCFFSFDYVSDGSDPDQPAGYRFVGSGSAYVRILAAH